MRYRPGGRGSRTPELGAGRVSMRLEQWPPVEHARAPSCRRDADAGPARDTEGGLPDHANGVPAPGPRVGQGRSRRRGGGQRRPARGERAGAAPARSRAEHRDRAQRGRPDAARDECRSGSSSTYAGSSRVHSSAPEFARKSGAVPSRSRWTRRGSQAPDRPVQRLQPSASAAAAPMPPPQRERRRRGQHRQHGHQEAGRRVEAAPPHVPGARDDHDRADERRGEDGRRAAGRATGAAARERDSARNGA